VGVAAVLFFRAVLKQNAAVSEQVANFDVHDARCSVEDDRPIVYRNISDMIRAEGRVEEGASDEVALEAFNGLCQKELPRVVEGSFSAAMIPYKYWVIVFFPHLARKFDEAAGLFADGFPMRDVAMAVLLGVLFSFAFWPVLTLLIVKGARLSLKPNLRGTRGVCLAVFVQGIVWVAGWAAYYLHAMLYRVCVHSSLGFALYTALTVAALIATAYIYRLSPWTARSGHRYVDLNPEDAPQPRFWATSRILE
jgi:hypothetical protein